jgi:riboflavin kinase / FMN adenylyltransferase
LTCVAVRGRLPAFRWQRQITVEALRDPFEAPPAASATRPPFIVSHDPDSAPAGLENCVAIIGNFDGVHRGHVAVIAQGRALARKLGRPCVVLTFEPHPADVFAGRRVVFRLTPEPVKALILERLGLDGMIVLRFDEKLAALPAAAFIDEVLIRGLGVSGVVVGFDFHFGAGRRGSPALLAAAGARGGFAVEVVEKVTADLEGSLEAVHSTAVRTALSEGDVGQAARLLGRPWFVLGEVIHGQKLGRELGFPTANLALDPSCGLRKGIYAVRVRGAGPLRLGAASFGTRPTVDDGPPLLEVFLFDYDGDLYGRVLEVEFFGWIRPEEKFADLPTLVERMRADVAEARAILAQRPPWTEAV